MIPKSLAFKPMDNVKDFINKFILAEKNIEVATLRNNIAVLKELEDLMAMTKEKIGELQIILSKNEEIVAKDREIKINEILISKAGIEAQKTEKDGLERHIQLSQQKLANEENDQATIYASLEIERDRLTNLQIAINQNETTQLIKDTQRNIDQLENSRKNIHTDVIKLENMVRTVADTLSFLQQHQVFVISREELDKLIDADVPGDEKCQIVFQLAKALDELAESYRADLVRNEDLLKQQRDKSILLHAEINNLRNKKLSYPPNTIKLKEAVEKEFIKLGISSPVRIFSDLLEISDAHWQNAVEGYLNTQRFYLITEPQHYRTALAVYNRIKKEVHTVGLVNTDKLDLDFPAEQNSLAYLINSANRHAKAYAIYLLNRVIRCDDVQKLKEHKVAITADCMLYQNYAVRKINEEVYRTPFIGAVAYEVQLRNKLAELAATDEAIKTASKKSELNKAVATKLNDCKIHVLEDNLNAPAELKKYEVLINREKIELQKAQNDPSYIQIQIQIDYCRQTVAKKQQEHSRCLETIGQLKNQLTECVNALAGSSRSILAAENSFQKICAENQEIATLGQMKYAEQSKSKSPAAIAQNYLPQRAGLENKRQEYYGDLLKLQSSYGSKYDCDLGSGCDQIAAYVQEHHKLTASDIIKYEADLQRAKSNCHAEFRESFLARLKENIENAKLEFKNLNSALRDIYYGEDSYKFDLTSNKKKESIYQMITAKNNEAGSNLWSDAFQDEYKEEMADLFAKLTVDDDKGEKVLAEYTDYRCYLDYDIIVEKKNGTVQRFSKIYGEKSGGETQTPYYVAIAASFVQLYKLGDTIRIIMLDEAFDKLDDNRISAMMDFFNSQHFQIILATPPSKIEIIGEKVDTVLMAMRDGNTSIIEEYDL